MNKRVMLGLVALGFLVAETASAARPAALIVMPARQRLVKLVFDVAALTGADMLSVQTPTNRPDAVLHFWSDGRWIPVTVGEYRAGMLPVKTPARIILIGSDRELSAAVAECPAWTDKIRIETLDIATVVTGLDAVFAFTPSEWRWLADRHGLKIEDTNAERRRYGRYGKPGSTPWMPPKTAPAARAEPAAVIPPVVEPAIVMPAPVPQPTPAPVAPASASPEPVAVSPVSMPAGRAPEAPATRLTPAAPAEVVAPTNAPAAPVPIVAPAPAPAAPTERAPEARAESVVTAAPAAVSSISTNAAPAAPAAAAATAPAPVATNAATPVPTATPPADK